MREFLRKGPRDEALASVGELGDDITDGKVMSAHACISSAGQSTKRTAEQKRTQFLATYMTKRLSRISLNVSCYSFPWRRTNR